MRVRFIIVAARLLGTGAVADLVKALEGDEEGLYVAQGASPEVAAIAADEREHAIIWDQLKAGEQLGDVTGPGRDGVAIAAPGQQRRRDRQPREAGIAPAAGPGRCAR